VLSRVKSLRQKSTRTVRHGGNQPASLHVGLDPTHVRVLRTSDISSPLSSSPARTEWLDVPCGRCLNSGLIAAKCLQTILFNLVNIRNCAACCASCVYGHMIGWRQFYDWQLHVNLMSTLRTVNGGIAVTILRSVVNGRKFSVYWLAWSRTRYTSRYITL